MKKLLILLLSAFSMIAYAQVEKVRIAVFDPIATFAINDGTDVIVREITSSTVVNSGMYDVIDRMTLNKLAEEQNFARNGMMDETQAVQIGKIAGASKVLFSVLASSGTRNMLTTKLIDVLTGTVEKQQYKLIDQSMDIVLEVENLTEALIGSKMPPRTITTTTTANDSQMGYSSHTASAVAQVFTETAWDINMKMIWVEGGDFLMGCTSEQSDCDSDEQNVRRVTVDGFYIGMLEVTQSQWEKVVGTSIYQQKSKAYGDTTPGTGPDYPMYYVSWDEAMEFCRLLSNKTGRTYTLPTEAQWEFAARGGNKNEGAKYAGSNMIDAVAWYTDNSGSSTHIVGSKRANALGIYDMSGNVCEWCKDWYANSYVSYDTNNPVGPSSGSDRVYRGGGWSGSASYCRVANRSNYFPNLRGSFLGFRVVLLP